MKKLLLLISIFALLSSCDYAVAQSFAASVVRVSDGDTILFAHADGNLDRARLLGLDAPEAAHNSKQISQPFGDACRLLLTNVLAGASVVTIETARRDDYGRNLSRILVGDLDVNLYVIKNGCGWLYYPQNLTKDLQLSYARAFDFARANKIGLFVDSKAVNPAIWRKRKRKHLKRQKK